MSSRAERANRFLAYQDAGADVLYGFRERAAMGSAQVREAFPS